MKKTINTVMSLALLLTFFFTTTVQAQVIARATATEFAPDNSPSLSSIELLATMDTVSETWFNTVDVGYATAIDNGNTANREKAIQDVIFIATQYQDKVAFRKVVSPLLNVYIFDKNKNRRLMALSALHAIGDNYGMQRLRELVNDEPSEQVRRLTRRALNDFYHGQ